MTPQPVGGQPGRHDWRALDSAAAADTATPSRFGDQPVRRHWRDPAGDAETAAMTSRPGDQSARRHWRVPDAARADQDGWRDLAGTPRPSGDQPDRHHWYDDEAGPLVRLYALTRGRTRPQYEVFDVITLVLARTDPDGDPGLGPEQASVLELCRAVPRSVADLAADLDLPLGVIRVILSDLLAVGHIQVTRPTVVARLPDENLLREVINGLRAL